MRRVFLVLGIALLPALAPAAQAQSASATRSTAGSPVYYGGYVSTWFGNPFRIGVFPLVGYRLTPAISLGVQAGYEYLNYDGPGGTTSNYGGAVFTRYRVVPQFYLHAEGRYVNYGSPVTSERRWVPFILVGGGVVQRLGPRTSAYVEALVDVLQDDGSPYEEWDPSVRVGVTVGF